MGLDEQDDWLGKEKRGALVGSWAPPTLKTFCQSCLHPVIPSFLSPTNHPVHPVPSRHLVEESGKSCLNYSAGPKNPLNGRG